jgi:hypothetical protein
MHPKLATARKLDSQIAFLEQKFDSFKNNHLLKFSFGTDEHFDIDQRTEINQALLQCQRKMVEVLEQHKADILASRVAHLDSLFA